MTSLDMRSKFVNRPAWPEVTVALTSTFSRSGKMRCRDHPRSTISGELERGNPSFARRTGPGEAGMTIRFNVVRLGDCIWSFVLL